MSVLIQDVEAIAEKEDLSLLGGKTILVSGATGLIGKTFVLSVLAWNQMHHNAIRIKAIVRDVLKAGNLFSEYYPNYGECLDFIEGDICTTDLKEVLADYIIHAANPTSSREFVEKPVETIRVALDGTRNMLECARRNSGSRLIYLSTMEVYGSPSDGEKIKESHGTDLDTMSVRTSYPESKRMCEALCKAYSSEYGVGVQILRLTQTFGPGVLWTDGRVFAEFARCAVEGRDIVLKTKGLTERCYLYTADAVRSIFTVLLSDRCNDVYNVANEDTYCSIFEMAELVANKIAGGRIRVRVEEDEKAASVYAPTLHMNLDTAKIRELGWKPEKNLLEMFKSMISDMNSGE